jgi:hypothetical protein
VVELFAELEAAAFHFAEVVPPPRRARRRRHRRRGRPAAADELGQRYRGAWRAALLHAFPIRGMAGELEMIELTAKTIPDPLIRALLEAAQREGRADICAACAIALRYPTTIQTLADAVRRFVARAWCADELNRRARLAMEYPRRSLTDTAASSERR